MIRFAWTLLAVAALVAAPASAFTVLPEYQYVAGQDAYVAFANGTVDVPIYLVETRLGGEGDLTFDGQNGLFSFDVDVEFAAGGTDPAEAVGGAANPAFNGVVSQPDPSVLIADRDLFEAEGVAAEIVNPDVSRVLLGAFTIEVGSVVGETTVFDLIDYENALTPGADENTFYWDDLSAANPLDLIIAPGQFSVTVIPEPATLILLAAGAGAVRRRLR